MRQSKLKHQIGLEDGTPRSRMQTTTREEQRRNMNYGVPNKTTGKDKSASGEYIQMSEAALCI